LKKLPKNTNNIIKNKVVKMDILGGEADGKKLILYSDHYKAESIFKDNELEIKVTSNKMTENNKYTQIPFIRGIYIFFMQKVSKGDKKKRKITINIFDIMALFLYLLDNIIFRISLMDYVYILFMLIHGFSVLFDKNIAELHGAEHMISNYYNKFHKISINDINKIKKSSVVHSRCGSNFYGMQIIILLLLKFLIDDYMIRYFIMTSLVYEISSSDSKILYCITYPLYIIGMLMQRLFFVKQPKDIDIKQAIKTVQELEEYDNERI